MFADTTRPKLQARLVRYSVVSKRTETSGGGASGSDWPWTVPEAFGGACFSRLLPARDIVDLEA